MHWGKPEKIIPNFEVSMAAECSGQHQGGSEGPG